MEPFPVDVLGGFHYFVVRLLEIVSEPGAIIAGHSLPLAIHYQSKRIEHHPAFEFLRNKVIHF